MSRLARTRILYVAAIFIAVLSPALFAQEVCAQASDTDQVQCLAQKIVAAAKVLQAAYEAALAKMPETDPTDKRRNRAQLQKAQSAWQAYMEANCAYQGGAEGGSNLWVTNFESRCELKAIEDRTAFLGKEAGLKLTSAVQTTPSLYRPVSQVAPETRSEPSPQLSQKLLDFLAAPLPKNASAPPQPAAPFASWTQVQKTQVPRTVTGQCRMLWTMMNPTGPPTLLPPGQDAAEASKLALEVCITAHLPRDWPPHDASIGDIQRILHRSAELGWPLSMPAPLTQ